MNLIFCDESCHLQNDNSDIMVLGGIKCLETEKLNVYNEIINIKEKYGLHKNSEIKWTKISKKYEPMYKEIIDYVMKNTTLNIRIILVTGKRELNHEKYNQTHDDWYYKIYYCLLGGYYNFSNQSKVFLDIKDTCGGTKIKRLKECLNHKTNVFGVYQIRSDESQLLQIIDIFIGMVGYNKRIKKNEITKTENTKQNLINYFQENYYSLETTSFLSNTKFNLFNWAPQCGGYNE